MAQLGRPHFRNHCLSHIVGVHCRGMAKKAAFIVKSGSLCLGAEGLQREGDGVKGKVCIITGN